MVSEPVRTCEPIVVRCLVVAVVVDEDAGCADVAVLADVGVTDVGQVRHLGAGADGGVLGLDERAELAVGAQYRAGPQVGERADDGAVADRGVRAVGSDHRGAVADGDVGQRGVRADAAADRRSRVPPSSWVPGWTTVSRPMVTSTSIQVVAGSTTVTPAS